MSDEKFGYACVVVGLIVAALLIAFIAVQFRAHADRSQVQQGMTERARIAACSTLDAQAKALCIGGRPGQ